MALPQPTNVPRIIEVLDPGANQLSIEVRMPPQLASKYPDKAWGTAIDTIGLAKKDSDRFIGYTLVDIQPMRDSEDLKWIFEKLSGPVWTTSSVGSENIIPEKFRSQVSQTKTKQEVVIGTAPTMITGDLISSMVEAQENTGKAIKVNISETIAADATAFVSPSLEDQLYVTTEILVDEDTLPDTGTGVVESTVQAIGKGKAIKTSKFAVTAYTNKTTYTVGYAALLNENVGSADSIPAKFRALKSLKTWRLRVQAAAPPSTPALGPGSGDYSGYAIVERAVKQTQENGNTDVFELVVVGLRNTGDNSLDSVSYGKIVTTQTTETLAAVGQTIDTGLHIIASTVEELGNGMSVKSTEQVQGGAWSNPFETDITKDGTQNPPARYLRDLTRKTTKKKVASVPSTVSLSTSEIAKSYKQETPDRAEEAIVTEDLTLNLSAIDEDVQQKPFVTITSVMTPGTIKVVPPNRNGGSKLVWDNGTTQIWENTEEVAIAREGPAGSNIDNKPFVEIRTDKRYSTSDTVDTSSGGANIVFNDGVTQVYEVSEITSTGRYGDAGAEQQVKPFVKITSTKSYEETGILGEGEVGGSNKIYDDGDTVVYEKSVETAEARVGLKGVETNAQQWGAIKSTTNYTTDETVPDGGSLQLVFTDGAVRIYEQTTTEPTIRGSTADIDSQPWGQVKWNGAYGTAVGGVRSRQVWSNGVTQVFLNETPSLTINGTTKELDSNSWGTVMWDGVYSGIPGGDRYKQVTSIGGQSVFLNETATVSLGGSSKEIDPNAWGSIEWEGAYASESGGVRSRKLTQIGNQSVYLNEEPALNIAAGSFVSAQETHPLYTTVENSSFSSSPVGGSGDTRSRQVFALGAERVFENIDRTVTSTGERTYGTMVKFTAPSVLVRLNQYFLHRRDGGTDLIFNPEISEGFEGYYPATVTEKYSEEAGYSGGTVINFGPAPVKISTPFGNVAIGPTLHGPIQFPWNLYRDPTYYDGFHVVNIPATPYADWRGVGRVLIGYETQPYLRGYITREIHVDL